MNPLQRPIVFSTMNRSLMKSRAKGCLFPAKVRYETRFRSLEELNNLYGLKRLILTSKNELENNYFYFSTPII